MQTEQAAQSLSVSEIFNKAVVESIKDDIAAVKLELATIDSLIERLSAVEKQTGYEKVTLDNLKVVKAKNNVVLSALHKALEDFGKEA